jgi:hypothetical protein
MGIPASKIMSLIEPLTQSHGALQIWPARTLLHRGAASGPSPHIARLGSFSIAEQLKLLGIVL